MMTLAPGAADVMDSKRRESRMRSSQAAARTRLRRSADAGFETLPPGHVVANRYQVESLIGRGGMGAVYAATHLVSGKRVALKWMLPSLSQVEGAGERFIREARANARIDHPNVVDVYDVGTGEGSVYLVMELLRGESLADRLDRERLPPEQGLGLLMPALRGVAAAHAQGVIHRDIKPDNIFLCQGPDGELREAKVLDFGISKIAAGQDLRDLSLTASGTVMGTPYYMSPEQVRGLKETDARSDVYGFGVILYELLADRYPFDAESYNELIVRIVTAEPPSVNECNPSISPALSQVVARAMARSPSARYQSVAELARELEPFAGGVPFRPPSSIPGEVMAPALLQRVSKPATVDVASAPTVTPVSNPVAVPAAAPVAVRGPRGWLGGIGVAILLALAAALWSTRSAAPTPHVVAPAPAGPAAEPAAHAPTVPATPAPTAPSAQVAAPSAGDDAEPASGRSARARRRARVSGAQSLGTQPGANALPADWDERLPTTIPPPPASNAKRDSASGKLTREDL